MGLDVGLRSSSLCIVDDLGRVCLERTVASAIEEIALSVCSFSDRVEGLLQRGLRRVLHIALAVVTALCLAAIPWARASLLNDTLVDASVQPGSSEVTCYTHPITGQFAWNTAGMAPGVCTDLGGAGQVSRTHTETAFGIAVSIHANGGWS